MWVPRDAACSVIHLKANLGTTTATTVVGQILFDCNSFMHAGLILNTFCLKLKIIKLCNLKCIGFCEQQLSAFIDRQNKYLTIIIKI